MLSIDRARCAYAPSYCEENIWQLLGAPGFAGLPVYALFLTNAGRSCAVWQQRLAAPGEPVAWDYHVVAVLAGDEPLVFDFDTRLPFPVSLATYAEEALLPSLALPPRLHPHFRLVDGPTFRDRFYSTRAHMRTADGGWTASPPPWSAIPPAPKGIELQRWVDLASEAPGRVLSLPALLSHFHLAPAPAAKIRDNEL